MEKKEKIQRMTIACSATGECTPITAFVDHEYVEEIQDFVSRFREKNPQKLRFVHIDVQASFGKTKIQFWNIGLNGGAELTQEILDLIGRITLISNNHSVFVFDGQSQSSLLTIGYEEIEE